MPIMTAMAARPLRCLFRARERTACPESTEANDVAARKLERDVFKATPLPQEGGSQASGASLVP